jgi:trans-aconitate 2-methyltransferase
VTWDPDQYHRFADERSQPFHDLLDLLQPRNMARAVDLGCGSG